MKACCFTSTVEAMHRTQATVITARQGFVNILLSKAQRMSPRQPRTCMLGKTFVGVSAAQMMVIIQVPKLVASTPCGRRCWPFGMMTSRMSVAERVNML